MKVQAGLSDAQTVGFDALASYTSVLAFLTASGRSRRRGPARAELPLLRGVKGIENLFHSLSAVAPATPGAPDEEWNPLSQRPHTPLPAPVGNELGAEITALKEAVDAFTTLSHEMMHVALWEPFFAGRWKPRSRRAFSEFSLMAEGFCFFFSDVIVSGAVRVRLPDGELALERETPSNARFHPVRAFAALGIEDHEEILGIYLEGFSGRRTALWKPRGTSNFVAALASQVYDFYAGTLRYLDEVHDALAAFGVFTELYRRFCAVPGLPTFLGDLGKPLAGKSDLNAYFAGFFRGGLTNLAELTEMQVSSVHWRRMLQMRAYYALQVRWLLGEGLVVSARALSPAHRRRLVGHLDAYLDGIEATLRQLARKPETSPLPAMAPLDDFYEGNVRAPLLASGAWAGQRWLIAPRRAGGCVSALAAPLGSVHDAKVALLRTVAFLVDELTRRMKDEKTVAGRSQVLARIGRVAALGAAGGAGGAAATRAAARALRAELATPDLLEFWSVPLAGFDPVGNEYRELVFSYQ